LIALAEPLSSAAVVAQFPSSIINGRQAPKLQPRRTAP
jgi:hypothetical protein